MRETETGPTKLERWIFHGPITQTMLDVGRDVCRDWLWEDSDLIAVRRNDEFFSIKRNKSGSFTIRRADRAGIE